MNLSRVFLLTLLLSLMVGCETFDPYTGEKKVSNTAKGAGIGAGNGAVLAYVRNQSEDSKTRRKRMLEAAGVGAIAGGGVGYYMDTQEANPVLGLRGIRLTLARPDIFNKTPN